MNRNGWARRFFDEIEAAHCDHNAWALVSWMQAEHAAADPNPEATWNPLNCTLRMPGSTYFNHITPTIGVQNYPDFATGMEATVRTIQQTNPLYGYAPILYHLRHCDSALATLRAIEHSSWGTGGLALRVLPGVKEHYWEFASHPIMGSSSPRGLLGMIGYTHG